MAFLLTDIYLILFFLPEIQNIINIDNNITNNGHILSLEINFNELSHGHKTGNDEIV
jgi:hypothetical protein